MSQLASSKRPEYWEYPWFRTGVFVMVAMIYVIFRSPYVGFNDGLSFLYEAEAGFSPYTNATSHFLYNNLQHILVSVFFFLPAVFVMTMFSIVCSLFALHRMVQLGRLFVGGMPLPWLLVPIVGLSFTFWQQSEIIEVYAFNNLIFLSFFYFALKDILNLRRQNYLLVSLLLGIGLLTHIQHLLSVPFFAWYLFSGKHLSLTQRLSGLGITLGLFLILFIPPLVADTNTIAAIFVDNQFSDAVMGFDMKGLLTGMGKGMLYFMYNYHMFMVFALYGWYLLWRDRRETFYVFLLIFLPYLGFAFKYNVNDNHVFFLIPNLLLILPSMLAMSNLSDYLLKYMKYMVPMIIMMSPMMYGMATIMGKKMEMVRKYDEMKAYKGGAVHLLWPGKMTAKDPLKLAKEIYHNDPGAWERGAIEWNYPVAVAYLKLRGELVDGRK